MTDTTKLRVLRLALRTIGVVLIFGLYPLTVLWPSGWAWHHGGPSYYLQMILGIYASLGVFLWLAARNPALHQGLIAFTIWSSVVHALIMAVQAIVSPEHMGHLVGDVPALLLIAAVLAYLCPSAARGDFSAAFAQPGGPAATRQRAANVASR